MKAKSVIKKIKNALKLGSNIQLPENTIEENLAKWSGHNWSQLGEEWSNNPEWKESFVKHVLNPMVNEGTDILEIGPGGGRWTEYLLEKAKNITLVDLTPECIDLCKERFKDYKNIKYFVNDGVSLEFVPDNSMDHIWSFDVFVHVQAKDIEGYFKQFPRILKKGGTGLIHHSKHGRTTRGWRSDMTAKKMKEFCDIYGLKLIDQFETWDDGNYRIWPTIPLKENPDTISVFKKE